MDVFFRTASGNLERIAVTDDRSLLRMFGYVSVDVKSAGHNDFLAAGGEMGKLIREMDWSKTPLGPIQSWPQSLRTSISIALDCAFPIVIWWGPELVILYNDEYKMIVGLAKHPAALGERGHKVWAEIWDVIGPMLSQVMERGEATRSRDLLLHVDRGYPEEAYFSFSYSPIYAETGKVAGIFCPVIETTEKIIGERRLRTLRDLAAGCKGAESEQAVYKSASRILAANLQDVPFAMIYSLDESQAVARLAAAAGIVVGPAAPPIVPLQAHAVGPWSLSGVARTTGHDRLRALAPFEGDRCWKWRQICRLKRLSGRRHSGVGGVRPFFGETSA